MNIEIFSVRKTLGLNLNFGSYFIFRRAYIRVAYIRKKVSVSEYGGLYSGWAHTRKHNYKHNHGVHIATALMGKRTNKDFAVGGKPENTHASLLRGFY